MASYVLEWEYVRSIDRWCVQTDEDDDANVRELDNGSMRAQQFNVNVNSTTAQRSVVMTVSSTGLVVREGTRDRMVYARQRSSAWVRLLFGGGVCRG